MVSERVWECLMQALSAPSPGQAPRCTHILSTRYKIYIYFKKSPHNQASCGGPGGARVWPVGAEDRAGSCPLSVAPPHLSKRSLLLLWKAGVSEVMVSKVTVTVEMVSEATVTAVMAHLWVRGLGGDAGNATKLPREWRPGRSFVSEEAVRPRIPEHLLSSGQGIVEDLPKAEASGWCQQRKTRNKYGPWWPSAEGSQSVSSSSILSRWFSRASGLRWGPPPCSPGPSGPAGCRQCASGGQAAAPQSS